MSNCRPGRAGSFVSRVCSRPSTGCTAAVARAQTARAEGQHKSASKGTTHTQQHAVAIKHVLHGASPEAWPWSARRRHRRRACALTHQLAWCRQPSSAQYYCPHLHLAQLSRSVPDVLAAQPGRQPTRHLGRHMQRRLPGRRAVACPPRLCRWPGGWRAAATGASAGSLLHAASCAAAHRACRWVSGGGRGGGGGGQR